MLRHTGDSAAQQRPIHLPVNRQAQLQASQHEPIRMLTGGLDGTSFTPHLSLHISRQALEKYEAWLQTLFA